MILVLVALMGNSIAEASLKGRLIDFPGTAYDRPSEQDLLEINALLPDKKNRLIAELVRALGEVSDTNDQIRATRAEYVLCWIGSSAIPALLEVVQKGAVATEYSKERIRFNAALRILGVIHPTTQEVRDTLLRLLEDKELDVRERAVKALAMQWGRGTPGLLGALRNDHPYIVAVAATALGEVAPPAECLPEMLGILERGSQQNVAAGVVKSLGKLKPVPEEVVKALVRFAEAGDIDGGPTLALVGTGIPSVIEAWKAREENERQARDAGQSEERAKIERELLEMWGDWRKALGERERLASEAMQRGTSEELKQYTLETLEPMAVRLERLCSQYVTMRGVRGLRDFAAQHGYGDLVK